MHSIVTTFRGADIKVEVANFCAAMGTLIDQDDITINLLVFGSNELDSDVTCQIFELVESYIYEWGRFVICNSWLTMIIAF